MEETLMRNEGEEKEYEKIKTHGSKLETRKKKVHFPFSSLGC